MKNWCPGSDVEDSNVTKTPGTPTNKIPKYKVPAADRGSNTLGKLAHQVPCSDHWNYGRDDYHLPLNVNKDNVSSSKLLLK